MFGIMIDNGNHNTVTNCDISATDIGINVNGGTQSSAVYVGTAYGNVITNNVVHDLITGTGEGIYMGNAMLPDATAPYVQDTVIENNTIYNVQEAIQNTVKTWINGTLVIGGLAPSGTIIRNNVIRNNRCEQGIASIMGTGHIIENNLIYDNLGAGARCGLSLRGGKYIVKNNLIANGLGTSEKNAINLNDVTGEITNNTISSYPVGITIAYSIAPLDTLQVRSNIVYGIAGSQIVTSGDISKVTIDNNFYGKAGSGLGTNYIVGNPLFTSDYHLQPGSRACGFGAFPCSSVPPTATQAISTDFLSLTPSRTAIPPSFTPILPTKTPTATMTKTPVPPTFTATNTPIPPTKTPTVTPTATAHCVPALDVWVCDKRP